MWKRKKEIKTNIKFSLRDWEEDNTFFLCIKYTEHVSLKSLIIGLQACVLHQPVKKKGEVYLISLKMPPSVSDPAPPCTPVAHFLHESHMLLNPSLALVKAFSHCLSELNTFLLSPISYLCSRQLLLHFQDVIKKKTRN